MIVGTAGHIDHGKTTLTRALTGVDTDRLQEEKERGISIELGYAYTPLPDGSVLGVIDVPGHEKFIRTMAAGVTGIDIALLVIAADDGIMPQTLEHLAILELLGVRRGVVAISKADRTSGPELAALEQAIRALLADTPFAAAPIFRTCATTPGDNGVAALKDYLAGVARALPARSEQRLFRLGVDRVFTLQGKGTVVTGTALAGQVHVGDTLALAPGGQAVRVRSIHAQNRPASAGQAGQRLALNLAGVDRAAIARGDWLVAPEMAASSERVDVELSLLPGSGTALKAWSPVHVHLGAAHLTANLVPLEGDSIAPGQHGRAQLVFDSRLHAVPGDRFVLRNAQATQTIGGGMVLDPFGPARKRRSVARLAWLDALKAFVGDGDCTPLVARPPHGLRASVLTRLTQQAAQACAPQVPGRPGAIMQLPLHGGDSLLIARVAMADLERLALAALSAFLAAAPDDAGPEMWRLKRIASPECEDQLWNHVIAALLERGAMQRTGRALHMPGHSIALTPQEQALADRLLEALLAGRYDPPWVRDLGRVLAVPEDDVRRLLRKLARTGAISQVVPDLFYHPAPLAELAAIIAMLPDAQAATFRDAAGLGRKRAVQLLEFFDRVGYTRRVGNTHMVRPNMTWP